jgi:predicted membrane channel-forming protein YqfA (hemolysin III family)
MENDARFRGAGGTPGGLGEFLIGLAMAAAGAYLLTQQVTVTSGYWHIWGYNAFGLTLLPLLFGVGMLFFNGRSKLGWLLLIAGAAMLLAGILMNLEIYFRSTSLFNTLMILILLFGGLGLVARSLRSH